MELIIALLAADYRKLETYRSSEAGLPQRLRLWLMHLLFPVQGPGGRTIAGPTQLKRTSPAATRPAPSPPGLCAQGRKRDWQRDRGRVDRLLDDDFLNESRLIDRGEDGAAASGEREEVRA